MRTTLLLSVVLLAGCPGSTGRSDRGADAAGDRSFFEGARWPDLQGREWAMSDTGHDQARDTAPPPDLLQPGGVSAYGQCQTGDPRAKLLGESAPPATVSVGAKLGVSVTFANCSNATWIATAAVAPSGYKLGSQSPQDNLTWGAGRFPLPADVAPNFQVKIPFIVVAPQTPGSYGYQWAIVQEGVAWILDQPSPQHTITVQAPTQTVQLCSGVTVELGGVKSASAGLQQCIDATPSGGTLELPAGVYLMTAPVQIAKPMTLRTAGTASSTAGCLRGGPACVVLLADAAFDADNGFFQIVQPAANVTVRHLVLNGNRAARLGSSAAATCASGNNRKGFNAIARGDGHTFSYNASINTLCGTGMEWAGHSATLVGNLFENNGDHTKTNMWSDGLTIHATNSSTVTGNLLRNNSDVDLIIGGGTDSTVSGNTIEHSTQAAFAGLMLDNFNGGTSGDFQGTTVSGNTVSCGPQLCDFAVNLGPHPWYLSANTIGGEVTANNISGGKINLNIDGAGTAAHPVKVHQNTLGTAPASASFSCGVRVTSSYNIGPDSVVDLAGDPTPHTSYTWHICP
jgi:hypothetical protein